MIRDHWRRIAGLHVVDDGTIATAWLALDKDADTVHLYDCALFKREVLAVIAEGLNARGRWVPIAWHKDAKEIIDKLLDRGCNTLPKPSEGSLAAAEVVSLDIWERMRSGRFKVDKRLAEWLEEYRSFNRQNGKVPRESHPLMAATRHAMADLEYARPTAAKRGVGKNFPKVATI